MKVGLTGSSGFIAWHLRCYFSTFPEIELVPIPRSAFQSVETLAAAISGCDAILHLACLIRGEQQALADVNRALAEKLTHACDEAKTTPQVVFFSSTKIFENSPYGNSKRSCGEHLSAWAKNRGAICTNLILPHVFGEGGQPFYNSGVATFCHQLAHGETPTIIKDIELELVHARQVAKIVHECLVQKHEGFRIVAGTKISVSQVLAKLTSYFETYSGLVVPKLETTLDVQLFNSLRFAMFPKHYPMTPKLHTDNRGSLFEVVRSHPTSQCFISSTKPGITRGNHYHTGKLERFCVIKGKASIQLRRLFTSEIIEFEVSGDSPQFVDIPTLHTHNITNSGTDELVTFFWTNEFYDPANSDTYPELVSKPNTSLKRMESVAHA